MQASVKQVQYLEGVEKQSGVRYTGNRWDFDEVSAYLSEYAKPKAKNKDSSESSENKQKFNKITDKQRQYIKVLENKTGIFFAGKTFEEAEAYIKENRTV